MPSCSSLLVVCSLTFKGDGIDVAKWRLTDVSKLTVNKSCWFNKKAPLIALLKQAYSLEKQMGTV